MIVECSRRPDGWIPVKGNEEEILNDDGSIAVSDGRPSFEDYVAVEFDLTDDFDWVKWLFKAPNIHSLHQNQITNTIKEWYTKPTPFRIQQGSILVFDKKSKYLHNVLSRTSVTIDDVLLENGYVVRENSINHKIYTLEKRRSLKMGRLRL